MGAPYVKGSSTSQAAAHSIAGHLGKLEADVFNEIKRCGRVGATVDEIEVALDMSHQTVSARVSTLGQRGVIINTGRKRKTRSGRAAFVHVIANLKPMRKRSQVGTVVPID